MQKLLKKTMRGELPFSTPNSNGGALGELLLAREELEKLSAKEVLLGNQIEQKKLNFERDTTALLLDISQSLEISKLKLKTLQKRVEDFVSLPLEGTITKVFFTNS